ncbi:hypothetical protein [Pseudocnuella soli]|uniref:hypothetical protein n=1 Tax=Pseudocnuella soli TaxID=2502779 RepID=UPI00105309F6|nr:hypothetical protein [Pseudocnuella soli]
MKRFNFLSVAVIAVLMVFAVGCTTLQEGAGGYYEDAPSGRAYRQAPYGNNGVIVVERDPFTGRYYQVSPYGNYGSPYDNYGYGYPANPRVYNRGGYYRGNTRPSVNNPRPNVNNGSRPSLGNNGVITQPQRKAEGSQDTKRAREILRGGN